MQVEIFIKFFLKNIWVHKMLEKYRANQKAINK